MAVSFFRDDNGVPLQGPEGLRPDFANTTTANTGAMIAELDIAAINVAGNRNSQGQVLLRVSLIGSNPAFLSLGAASAAPSSNADMIRLAPNSVNYFAAKATDVSVYHQQITGASALDVCAMV